MKEDFRIPTIIFLSDSKRTPTNIPYRIKNALQEYTNSFKFYFISFNLKDLSKLVIIICKLIFQHQKVIIHSHHLKSLIINALIKILSKLIVNNKILSYHSFHCEFKRYSKLKLLIIFFSKYCVDEYSCVSKNLKLNWDSFLKREIKFIPIGISKKEKQTIKRESYLFNKKNEINLKKEKEILITWIGRFEEVKNPIFLLDSLSCLNANLIGKIKVIFVGDGKLVEIFKKKLSIFINSNFNKNLEIKYIGMKEREEVHKLVASSNVYVNTSSSESFCVSATEFLSNPFCKLIMPNIENLKEIYNCERVDFYEAENLTSLTNVLKENIDNYFKTQFKSQVNIYPRNFSKYTLEETAQILFNSYKFLLR